MDTHVIRLHFTDGTSELAGTLGGGKPAKVDATFARDVNAGWELGVGETVADGRTIARCTAETEDEAMRSAA